MRRRGEDGAGVEVGRESGGWRGWVGRAEGLGGGVGGLEAGLQVGGWDACGMGLRWLGGGG